MRNEEAAISEMIKVSRCVAGEPASESEIGIAEEIAKQVIYGNVNHVLIVNAGRGSRKRIIGIAFNMIGNEPLKCKLFKRKDSVHCEKCSKTCCYNKILQRRFAGEMFPGFKVY